MDYAEIILNNIATIALIPIVLAIVFKLKGAQIDSLKEQNNVLRSQMESLNNQIKSLKKYRISEMEKDYDTAIKFAKRKGQEFIKTKKELEKLKAKVKQKKELKENEWKWLYSFFESTEECLYDCAFCYHKSIRTDTYLDECERLTKADRERKIIRDLTIIQNDVKVLKKLKIYAAKNNMQLSEVIEQLIDKKL